MHVALVIVICIVILGMVVEASLNGRVHAEYIRRRQAHGQSRFNTFNELPDGVHIGYIRRRVHSHPYVKILNEIPARKHRRQPTSRVRPHIRQRNVGSNIHI